MNETSYLNYLGKKCRPCEGGVEPLGTPQIEKALGEIPGWERQGIPIEREFRFKDFRALMQFVNQIADLAEEEAHHPDFHIHYNRLRLSLWTHTASGLTENDFILAAKINERYGK